MAVLSKTSDLSKDVPKVLGHSEVGGDQGSNTCTEVATPTIHSTPLSEDVTIETASDSQPNSKVVAGISPGHHSDMEVIKNGVGQKYAVSPCTGVWYIYNYI